MQRSRYGDPHVILQLSSRRFLQRSSSSQSNFPPRFSFRMQIQPVSEQSSRKQASGKQHPQLKDTPRPLQRETLLQLVIKSDSLNR